MRVGVYLDSVALSALERTLQRLDEQLSVAVAEVGTYGDHWHPFTGIDISGAIEEIRAELERAPGMCETREWVRENTLEGQEEAT